MRYSRKQISKAGEKVLTSKNEEEVDEALEIINSWRTAHLLPLIILKNRLLRILKSIDIEPNLVSQRLKRLTSITYKLDLNPSMGLGGMQDIGGYRAVLKDVDDLKNLDENLRFQRSYHKLEKINDYTIDPKESGYRSIHYIYRFTSSKEEYDGLKIELQIRTKLQHNWATAVETAGILTKTSLKSNQGPDEWLDFFKIVSSLFAMKEELPVMKEHKDLTMQNLMVKCYEYCEELSVLAKLKAIRISSNRIENDGFPGDYYLLNINISTHSVKIKVFNKKQFEEATNEYLSLEKSIDETKNAVVLVSATSIKTLKKAYPSYFLDTSEFISAIEKINLNCKILKYI